MRHLGELAGASKCEKHRLQAPNTAIRHFSRGDMPHVCHWLPGDSSQTANAPECSPQPNLSSTKAKRAPASPHSVTALQLPSLAFKGP